jgi:nucleotide sugar dehydrogenase
MEKLTVIGIGRLGLCSALIFENAGYNILGVDVNELYIKKINNKTLFSYEPFVMDYLKKSKNLKATTSLIEGLSFSDIIFIVVPTPNGGDRNYYNHSILDQLLFDINKIKIKNKHLIICCTIMPHYIDTIGKLLIKDCEGTTLNYNPEFIAQGEIIHSFENPDIVLIGQENDVSGSRIESIYKKITKNTNSVICRMTPLEAELTKIAVNGYITCKISYATIY